MSRRPPVGLRAGSTPTRPPPGRSHSRGRRSRTPTLPPAEGGERGRQPAGPASNHAGLSRTIPDRNGPKRAENTPKVAPRFAARRCKPLKTQGFLKPLRTRAHRPDRSRAAISCPCRAPSAASANDAGSRAARKADHGPRDNFRPLAGRGRPRAWRGWGFRAGGAARARAPGSPRKRFRGITSPRRLLSDIAVAGQGARGRRLLSSPLQGGGEKTQGGGEKVAAVRPLSGDSDVGEVSGALALRLLPPSGGRPGGGFRADMPALPGRRHASGQPPRASMARSMRRMRRGVSARAAQRLR